MSVMSSGILAFSMSTDAFAVSLGKGAVIRSPRIRDALRIATVFGTVEMVAPILGWLAGLFASSIIKDVDHWIAFVILCTIGITFIYGSFSDETEDEEKARKPHSLGVLFLTAIATSIDAFAIGLSLAFVGHNILMAAVSIGLATFLMVTIGIMAGQFIGKKIGRYAERLGGLGLIFIGTKILLEHLYII